MESKVIRVLIADDQAIVRMGLKTMIEMGCDDIAVVGMVDNGREAVTQAQELGADVVLMDIRMPVLDGIRATEELARAAPHIRVIALTTFDSDDCIEGALQAGSSGYLLKDMPGDGIIHAIKIAHLGGSTFSPEIQSKMMHRAGMDKKPPVTRLEPVNKQAIRLPPREQEILQLLADGCNNEEVAQKLYLSSGTVRNYVSRIYARLEVSGRTKAVLKAIDLGLVNRD